MHHRNPIKDFYYFFFRNESLLTLLNEYTQFFTILFFSFLAEIACGKIIITPFTSDGRENFGTTNMTHFKNWVWGLGFGLEREAHFVLHMNHWPISLSLYQQRVLPRHWAFVPIKMALFFSSSQSVCPIIDSKRVHTNMLVGPTSCGSYQRVRKRKHNRYTSSCERSGKRE